MKPWFPFSAFVGADAAKRAIELVLVDPLLGGIVLTGCVGSGKSTLARASRNLLEGRAFVEFPITADETAFVESDPTRAFSVKNSFSSGSIFSRARGGLVFIDGVDFLPRHLANFMLDARASAARGEFTVVATASDIRALPPQLGQCFGLAAAMEDIRSLGEKILTTRRLLDADMGLGVFREAFSESDARLAAELRAASQRLTHVVADDGIFGLAAEMAAASGGGGNRAEILLVRAARANAAFEGRTEVFVDDIGFVAPFVLRLYEDRAASAERAAKEDTAAREDHSGREDRAAAGGDAAAKGEAIVLGALLCPNAEGKGNDQPRETVSDPMRGKERKKEEPLGDIERRCLARPGGLSGTQGKMTADSARYARTGDRPSTRTAARGRVVGSREAGSKCSDIALFATLRAAAIRSMRDFAGDQSAKNGAASRIEIRSSDIRRNVRENFPSRIAIFVLDSSGSMGSGSRMAFVRKAVTSFLDDSYKSRSRVAVVVFSGDGAELVVPTTKSVDRAHRALSSLHPSGKTPLASGLRMAAELADALRGRERGADIAIIVVSDGNINKISRDAPRWMSPEQELSETLRILRDRKEGCYTYIVADASIRKFSTSRRTSAAKKIAEELGADYVAVHTR